MLVLFIKEIYMKKKILCLLTILFCLVIPFVVSPAATAQAQTPTSGYTFASDTWYYVDGTMKAPPKTIETWIYVPEEYATANSTIFSNYNGFGSMPYFLAATICVFCTSLKWEL